MLALSLMAFDAAIAVAKAPELVPVEQRVIAGGRAIRVLVAQPEIKSGIFPSNASARMNAGSASAGAGLAGAMPMAITAAVIDSSVDASRTKKAEGVIVPIRNALTDFDGDGLALQTTRAAIAEVPWLQTTDIAFSKDSSLLGKSALLDKASTTQTMFIEYTYGMSGDFSAVVVNATIHIASKALAPDQTLPESRVQPNHLLYANVIAAVLSLPDADPKNPRGNAARWAADNGKLARVALNADFARVAKLLPRTLALTGEEIKDMRSGRNMQTTLGGLTGRVVEDGVDGTLLWTTNAGFSSVDELPSGG
jgi:hypothetical protein